MNDELIEKYYLDIFKWSFAKTKTRFEAEDLTQEIVYQIIKMFTANSLILDPEKYLWKIAYYTWCNKVRKNIKDKCIYNNDTIDQIKDDKIDILRKIELEEINEHLNLIIDNLGETMKTIVKLYYYDDLQIKEISNRLNIKESLTKYYLFEARSKIKQKMIEKKEK